MIICICGAGGLGHEVLELAKQINYIEKKWSSYIFVETEKFINNYNNKTDINNILVTTFEKIINRFDKHSVEFIVGVGEPELRKNIAYEITCKDYHLATLIHPNVHIPDSTTIGKGVVICSNAYISCDVTIGNNAYIQPNALVGHNTIIGNNSVISPSVNIAGACQIGCNTYIGMNACVKEETHIGDDTIIGIASVVIRDIPSEMIALGNPARPMKKNEERRVFK